VQSPGAPGDRGWPALAAAPDGAVHAVWLDHRGRSALYHAAGGAERSVTTDVCYCCKTALAAAAGGRVFAAWRHVYPDNMRDIAFTWSRDGGKSFGDPVRVSHDEWQLNGCPDDGPALAVDARGAVHLAWPTLVAGPEPHKAIFYATSTDGRAFSPRLRVSMEGRHASHPQIALDPDGRAVVVWDEAAEGTRQAWLAQTRRGAAGFEPPMKISGDAPASYPVVARVNDGFLVAWTEGGGDASTIRIRQVAARR